MLSMYAEDCWNISASWLLNLSAKYVLPIVLLFFNVYIVRFIGIERELI